jgi:hypothetical protein
MLDFRTSKTDTAICQFALTAANRLFSRMSKLGTTYSLKEEEVQ